MTGRHFIIIKMGLYGTHSLRGESTSKQLLPMSTGVYLLKDILSKNFAVSSALEFVYKLLLAALVNEEIQLSSTMHLT